MMYQTIQVSENDRVFTLWLNRPEARNAFNPQMIEEIRNAIKEIAAQNPRMVIIRGKNHQFCSGADIKWMKRSGTTGPEENARESQRIADLLKDIYDIQVPTLALAEGGIFGGAIGLLAVCDWVYAAADSQFGFPEVQLGIIPAVIWPFVLLKCHPIEAMQKALTGKPFNVIEAERLRLVSPLPPEGLAKSVDNLVHDICSAPSPDAQTEIKALTRKLQQKPNETVIKETIEILSKLKQSPNGQEGLKAFIEKRRPEWKKLNN